MRNSRQSCNLLENSEWNSKHVYCKLVGKYVEKHQEQEGKKEKRGGGVTAPSRQSRRIRKHSGCGRVKRLKKVKKPISLRKYKQKERLL